MTHKVLSGCIQWQKRVVLGVTWLWWHHNEMTHSDVIILMTSPKPSTKPNIINLWHKWCHHRICFYIISKVTPRSTPKKYIVLVPLIFDVDHACLSFISTMNIPEVFVSNKLSLKVSLCLRLIFTFFSSL